MQRAKWRSVAINFPLLAQWEDAELEERYIGRDGRWSGTTREILKALRCDRLDLNLGWASVSQSWRCAACGRDKPRIARVTAAGVALLRLEEHHDHLGDTINAGLREKAGQNWVEVLAPGAGKLANSAEKLVRRFEPNLICHDCNLADGAAKNALGDLPRAFSFSPSEIRRFINAAPNREHRIDFDKAREVWNVVRPQFQRNLALAQMLVDQIASGSLVQEPGAPTPTGLPEPLGMFGHLHACVRGSGHALIAELHADLDAFERRSIARDGTASGKPRVRVPVTPLPTQMDVDAHDGNGSPDLWHSAGSDWTCAGCERTRLGLLRSSRNKIRKWSARLHKHAEYVLAESASGYTLVDTHINLLICGDCLGILTGVKQRDAALSHDAAFLQIADLKALANAKDHQPHAVDWPDAAARVRANLGWREAVDSYRRHHAEAKSCRSLLAAAVRELGFENGRQWLENRYAREHPGWEDDEIRGYVEVLLEDAERLPEF